jgi:hypothetical protein
VVWAGDLNLCNKLLLVLAQVLENIHNILAVMFFARIILLII